MQKRSSLPFLASLLLLVVVVVASASQDARTAAHNNPANTPAVDSSLGSLTLQLQEYAGGLDQPVGIANAGDYRLFVLEKAGRIKVVQQDSSVLSTPFLDISQRVDSSSFEEGLLGMAFHPRYDENGLFYVNYTNTSNGVRRTRISRFKVSADPNVALANSENILLTIDQPYSNHNAGKILFGPDGYLYIPLGDGGDGGDPHNNAQTDTVLLGKINRIDVDNGFGSAPDCQGLGSGDYVIPADNPFADGPGGSCDEIWAVGLRNPWQSSFDSLTNDLFVADVGQNQIEEVNIQPSDSAGAENYGWSCFEGSAEYPETKAECGPRNGYTFPIFEYTHGGIGGCSVTGGYVYRGRHSPSLFGHYILTDYCSGRFWDLVQLPNESWQATVHEDVFIPGENSLRGGNAAFGQRCDGELFVANMNLGEIYHLTGSSSADMPRDEQLNTLVVEPNQWIYLPLFTLSGCR